MAEPTQSPGSNWSPWAPTRTTIPASGSGVSPKADRGAGSSLSLAALASTQSSTPCDVPKISPHTSQILTGTAIKLLTGIFQQPVSAAALLMS